MQKVPTECIALSNNVCPANKSLGYFHYHAREVECSAAGKNFVELVLVPAIYPIHRRFLDQYRIAECRVTIGKTSKRLPQARPSLFLTDYRLFTN